MTADLPAGIDGTKYIYVVLNRNLADPYDPLSLDYTTHVFQGPNDDPMQHVGSTTIGVIYREADLVPSGLTASTADPHAGDTIAVNWSVTNQGTRDTRTNSWADGIYLSSSPSLSLNSPLLGKVAHTGVLAVGASYPGSLSVQLPQGIQGDFYLVLFTDNPGTLSLPGSDRVKEYRGEDNNLIAIPLHVQPAPLADLEVTSVTPQVPHVTAGQPFKVTWTVTNQGGADATGSWYEDIYLASDRLLDPQHDLYMDRVTYTGGLKAGASYAETATITAPSNVNGPYYILVQTGPSLVPNPPQILATLATVRHSGASVQPVLIDQPPPSDLQVASVEILQSSGRANGTVTIQWTVTNDSANPAQGIWSDAVYLSQNTSWDLTAIPLGHPQHPGSDPAYVLAGGQSYTTSLTTTIPPLAPGDYRAIVRTDVYDEVPEATDENKSVASLGTFQINVDQLSLGVPQPVDLGTDQDQLFQVTVAAGQTMSVSLSGLDDSGTQEVLIRSGGVPSDLGYDAISQPGTQGSVAALGPTTVAGTYYILVRGTTTNVSAEPRAPGPGAPLRDYQRDQRRRRRRQVRHDYHQRRPVPAGRLREADPAGLRRIPAGELSGRQRHGDHRRVRPDRRPHGLYDVAVINPDGAEAIVPYRYLVEQAIAPDVTVALGGPRVITAGSTVQQRRHGQQRHQPRHALCLLPVRHPGAGHQLGRLQLQLCRFRVESRGPAAGGRHPRLDAGGRPLGQPRFDSRHQRRRSGPRLCLRPGDRRHRLADLQRRGLPRSAGPGGRRLRRRRVRPPGRVRPARRGAQ